MSSITRMEKVDFPVRWVLEDTGAVLYSVKFCGNAWAMEIGIMCTSPAVIQASDA